MLQNPRDMILFAVLAVGMLVRLWVILGVRLFQEDALITLRYARNLWRGQGLVFNTAQHVLGVTSPLWTFITSPIVGLLEFSTASVLIGLVGFVCFFLAVLVWIQLARECHFSYPALFTLVVLLAFQPTLVTLTVAGMEAALFVLCISVSLLAVARGQYLTSSLTAGLALLTRPEGIVWIGCLLLYRVVVERRIPWRELFSIAIVVTPWVVFATLYYGSPIPQSAIAKTNWLSNELTLERLFWRPSSLYNIWIGFNGISFLSLPSFIQGGLAALWAVLFGLGTAIAWRKREKILLLNAGFFVAYLSFYYFGSARVFEWYWIPGIVSSSCIIALAVGYLIDAAAQTAVKFLHLPRIRPVVIGVLLLLVLSLSGSILAYKASRFEELQAEEDLGRRPAGEYLARCTVASARVMLEPIGYIGFFSDREIIDLAGLVTPEFAAVAQKQSPGWMMGKIRQVKPEYILLRAYEIKDNEFFASGGFPLFEGPEDRAWFMNNYRETVTFGPGKSAMVVWRRSDVVSACLD